MPNTWDPHSKSFIPDVEHAPLPTISGIADAKKTGSDEGGAAGPKLPSHMSYSDAAQDDSHGDKRTPAWTRLVQFNERLFKKHVKLVGTTHRRVADFHKRLIKKIKFWGIVFALLSLSGCSWLAKQDFDLCVDYKGKHVCVSRTGGIWKFGNGIVTKEEEDDIKKSLGE